MSWSLIGGFPEPLPVQTPVDDQPSALLSPRSAFQSQTPAAILDEAAELHHHLRRIHYVWAAVTIHPDESGDEFIPAWNQAAAQYRRLLLEPAARAA